MSIAAESAKWIQTIKVSWSNQLAYKMSFVLLVIGPTVVFFFIKYNLWSSIFAMEGVESIQGYTLSKMLEYQAWMLIVSFLAQGYNNLSLSEDIRMGRISSYLIYPFGFWQFHAAGFIAFQFIQMFVATLSLAVFLASDFVQITSIVNFVSGLGFCFLVGFFWFSANFVLGLIAFWLEETWVLRVMFLTVAGFLSGAIIPLELYPPWLASILEVSPFPYIAFVPIKIFMGEYSGNLGVAAMILVSWSLIVSIAGHLVWRKGIKLYTAAGM